MSYSADEDPNADGFNTHQGYEADLLTALEAMEGAGLSFSRTAIPEWPGIWLKSAEPAYDMIGGGITILDSRTKDAAGTPRVIFTSGHVKFRQSLLVRAEDAELATCIDEKINYLTDDTNIGYAEWLRDPSVFMNRAEMWNATRQQ